MSAPNPATSPAAVFYRRTLIDLDNAALQLREIGATAAVVDAFNHYRAAVQEALHTQGVSR